MADSFSLIFTGTSIQQEKVRLLRFWHSLGKQTSQHGYEEHKKKQPPVTIS